MRSLRKTETDQYVINTAIRELQNHSTGVTPLSEGGTGAALVDPNKDRFMMWDDSAGTVKFVPLADLTDEAGPAAGDFLLVQRAEDEIVKVNWNHLPGFGGGLSNVVEDTSPTLGGNLDGNAFSLGTVGSAAADLFLESGGVINWSSGDVTITHSAGLLTVSDPVTLGANAFTCGAITSSTLDLGGVADTTITRASAGVAAVEGKNIYVVGGADVALADGGTGATLVDPNLDRLMVWDDSATTVKFAALADLNLEAAPAAGDFLIVQRAEDDIVKVNWNTLPGFGGGLSNVSDDTSPTLGGNLDGNTFSIGTVGSPVADLFLESGGVINWSSGDITVTHSANALDFAGGNFNFDSITLDAPLAIAQGGTGQITVAEAIGEMTQALTEDTTPDFTVDFVPAYDSSADTGSKIKLSTLLRPTALTAPIGYQTGTGGTVTQATSKSTGVTLSTLSGQITMNGAALASQTGVTFTVTNTLVAATDVIITNEKSNFQTYTITPVNIVAGAFGIRLYNNAAISHSDAVVINFVVLKGVTA